MTDAKICTARFHASSLHEELAVAYWDECRRDFHMERARDSLKNIASELGFDLVEREAPAAALVETLSEAAQ